MKKTIVGALILALLLTGCGQKKPAETTAEPEITAAPTEIRQTESAAEPTEAVKEAPSEPETAEISSICMTQIPHTDRTAGPDGGEAFSISYPEMLLEIPGNPQAQEKILEELRGQIQHVQENAASYREAALQEYSGEASWTPYFSNIHFDPRRMDTELISFSGTAAEFTGGSHPNVSPFSVTFSAKTGDYVKIKDMMQGSAQLSQLEELVLEILQNDLSDRLMDGYEETVKQRFTEGNASTESWYLSDAGLVYYFAPYEVAPYQEGTVEAVIPYEKLTGIIRDEYLITASEKADFDLKAGIASETELNAENVHTITTDPEGEHIYLYGFADGTDIRISTGYWDMYDNQYYAEEILFAADGLSTADALEIVTYIPDAAPNIQILINGTEILYLSQSGMDGSILLLDSESVF